jgi:hypothetical protein
LSTTGKVFKKVIQKIVQRHIEERGLLKASQFGFHAHHSMTFQGMRLMDLVTLNFNSTMSTTSVFLDIGKALDATWHLGLLYIFSKLQFLISLLKLISSFLSQRNFRVLVEGEMATPRDIQAGLPPGSILPPHFTVYTYK